MILYIIYKNVGKKTKTNRTEQQESEGTVKHNCDDIKLDFPSQVEMKENPLNQV